jgi:hypothetical protein
MNRLYLCILARHANHTMLACLLGFRVKFHQGLLIPLFLQDQLQVPFLNFFSTWTPPETEKTMVPSILASIRPKLERRLIRSIIINRGSIKNTFNGGAFGSTSSSGLVVAKQFDKITPFPLLVPD